MHSRSSAAAAKYGLKPSEELYEYLALAAQHRLTDVVEKLTTISKQRLDIYKVSAPRLALGIWWDANAACLLGETKDEMQIEVTSDPRKQLKLIEKREKEEKERRDAEEKERALKEKKPEADKKKSDQARLEEEEKIRTRTANLTALQVRIVNFVSSIAVLRFALVPYRPSVTSDLGERRQALAPWSLQEAKQPGEVLVRQPGPLVDRRCRSSRNRCWISSPPFRSFRRPSN